MTIQSFRAPLVFTLIVLLSGIARADTPDYANLYFALAQDLQNVQPAEKRQFLIDLFTETIDTRGTKPGMRNQVYIEEQISTLCKMPDRERLCRKLSGLLVLSCRNRYYQPLFLQLQQLRTEVESKWPGIQMSVYPASAAKNSLTVTWPGINMRISSTAATKHNAEVLRDLHEMLQVNANEALKEALSAQPLPPCAIDQAELDADPDLKTMYEAIREKVRERAIKSIVEYEELDGDLGILIQDGSSEWLRSLYTVYKAISEAALYRRMIGDADTLESLAVDQSALTAFKKWRRDEVTRMVETLYQAKKQLRGPDMFSSQIRDLIISGIGRTEEAFREYPMLRVVQQKLQQELLQQAQDESNKTTDAIIPLEEERYWYKRLQGLAAKDTHETSAFSDPPASGCDSQESPTYQEHYETVTDGLPIHFFAVNRAGPRSNHNGVDEGKAGEILIRIEQAGKMVLVFSAAESTTWKLSLAPGTQVERIILVGSSDQKVEGPNSLQIERVANEGEVHAWPSYEALGMVRTMETRIGGKLASYQSCQHSEWFFLPRMEATVLPRPTAPENGILAPCAQMLTRQNVCMGMHQGAPIVSVIDLDGGEVCSQPLPLLDTPDISSSLGWTEDKLYFCVPEQGVVEFNLRSGRSDIALLPCSAVTTDERGRLYVLVTQSAELREFGTFAEIKANSRYKYFSAGSLQLGSLAVFREQAYSAMDSDDKVAISRLSFLDDSKQIPLRGFYDSIFGIAVPNQSTVVIAAPAQLGGIHVFDLATGEVKKKIPVADLEGINCRTRPKTELVGIDQSRSQPPTPFFELSPR